MAKITPLEVETREESACSCSNFSLIARFGIPPLLVLAITLSIFRYESKPELRTISTKYYDPSAPQGEPAVAEPTSTFRSGPVVDNLPPESPIPTCEEYVAQDIREPESEWPDWERVHFDYAFKTKRDMHKFMGKQWQFCPEIDGQKPTKEVWIDYPEVEYPELMPSTPLRDADIGIDPSRVLIMMSDDRYRNEYNEHGLPEYWSASSDINEKYAQTHGYKFEFINVKEKEITDGFFHSSYYKLYLINKILEGDEFDYIVYLDSDCWITELERPIGHLLKWANLTTTKSVLMSAEPPHSYMAANAGIIILRKTEFSINWIRNWLSAVLNLEDSEGWLSQTCESDATGVLERFRREWPWENGALVAYMLPRYAPNLAESEVVITPFGYPFGGPFGYFIRHMYSGDANLFQHKGVSRRVRYLREGWVCTMCKTTRAGDVPTQCPRCQDIPVGWQGPNCYDDV